MFSDICFFHSKQYKVSLYPSLDYISDVIEESVVQTSSLKGLRQLSITRREEGKTKQIIVIYNYRYTNSTDSFGVCLVFNDYYPCGVNYLFSYFGEVIANIIKEGKLLFLDKKSGTIHATNQELRNHSATIKRHIDKFKKYYRNGKAELVKTSTLSSNYYSIFKKQTIVHQLSDTSWNITESLNYNNIVIITEEIEDENINNIRSIIKESNETIDNLNKQISKLKEQLKQAEKEKKKQRPKVNPPQKTEVKKNDNLEVTGWIVLGIFAGIILLNLIVPWFIPTIWPKLAVVFTGLGTYFIVKALDDDSNKKFYEILGWSGAIAILLSTVLIIYGLCGGFSSGKDVTVQDEPTKSIKQMIPTNKENNIHVNEDTQDSFDEIWKSPSVTMADLEWMERDSIFPPESKNSIEAIKYVYKHFNKVEDLRYAFRKWETCFSPKQVEIMKWFFDLPKYYQEQWERSSITAESFEDFQEKVKKMIDNNPKSKI